MCKLLGICNLKQNSFVLFISGWIWKLPELHNYMAVSLIFHPVLLVDFGVDTHSKLGAKISNNIPRVYHVKERAEFYANYCTVRIRKFGDSTCFTLKTNILQIRKYHYRGGHDWPVSLSYYFWIHLDGDNKNQLHRKRIGKSREHGV